MSTHNGDCRLVPRMADFVVNEVLTMNFTPGDPLVERSKCIVRHLEEERVAVVEHSVELDDVRMA